MKKIVIFIGGVVTGAILMIIVSLFMAGGNSAYNGITLFEKEGECISENSFHVFQVLDSGEALAEEVHDQYQDTTLMFLMQSSGLVVLFLNENGQSYYDDQVIKMPTGKCAKQIGVFKYSSKSGLEKTIPIVGIRSK